MSDATSYTVSLLDTFEDTLPIQWDNHQPFLVDSQITAVNISKLQEALLDIFRSTLKDKAIHDLERYGKSGSIQTSGVGLADDFNTFVNLGLLIGERVVLWDTVILSVVFPPDGRISIQEFSNVVLNFILLKDAIHNGHVIMLPNPATWLQRCQRYYQAVHQIGGITPTFSGYLHSRALLDEGFKLHPYTMQSTTDTNGKKYDIRSAINLIQETSEEAEEQEERERQERKEVTADDLVFDVEFSYLTSVETRQLSNFLLQHSAWKKDLDRKLKIPTYIKTAGDIKDYLSETKREILLGIERHNANIPKLKTRLSDAGVNMLSAASGLISGTIGMAVNIQHGGSSLGTFGAGIGVLGAGVATIPAFLALSKVLKKPDDSTVTLHQGFTIIRDMDEANKLLQRIR